MFQMLYLEKNYKRRKNIQIEKKHVKIIEVVSLQFKLNKVITIKKNKQYIWII